MLIAKVNGSTVVEVADHKTLFPNTSFTASGPNDEFLSSNGCVRVVMPTYDPATHKAVSIPPIVVGDHVEIAEVVGLTVKDKTPKQVSPRQIRQALTTMNLRSSVEAAVGASDQNTKDWWEFATTIERNHLMVAAMAASLGVTDAQLDELFTLAGSL